MKCDYVIICMLKYLREIVGLKLIDGNEICLIYYGFFYLLMEFFMDEWENYGKLCIYS